MHQHVVSSTRDVLPPDANEYLGAPEALQPRNDVSVRVVMKRKWKVMEGEEMQAGRTPRPQRQLSNVIGQWSILHIM